MSLVIGLTPVVSSVVKLITVVGYCNSTLNSNSTGASQPPATYSRTKIFSTSGTGNFRDEAQISSADRLGVS